MSYEEVQEFVLSVSVADLGGGSGPLRSSPAGGRYTVQVQDVNEPPVCFHRPSSPARPLDRYAAQLKEKSPPSSLGSFFICDR